ncbi:hypothetical protein [Microlunatus parietis]|uniref:Uncharacterized protein n=1 Tax=Microlunatus parietis TaxID=682979 RepID=A0A7Y9IE52_9ACTN|nr:hypothetical protein [Microlunatus parietis]NYE74931.1 hypothetical protein [Microlunatus parietis]
MANFRATTGDGRVIEEITPETLRPLLTGGAGSVIMEGPDGRVARAESADDGRWMIKITPGQDAPSEAATVPNGDAAFDALRSWAADDDWWREAFTWTPLP